MPKININTLVLQSMDEDIYPSYAFDTADNDIGDNYEIDTPVVDRKGKRLRKKSKLEFDPDEVKQYSNRFKF